MNITRTLCLTVAGACLSSCALAGPPYSVEDPGTNEPGLQTVILAMISSQIDGRETQSTPAIWWKLGIKDSSELKILFGAISKRASGKERATGLADTTVTYKWRFQNETRRRPQIALGYSLKIPTANGALGLGTGNVDHKLFLTAGKSLKRYKVYGNLGYALLGNDRGRSYLYYGAVATYQATEHLVVGAQLYGNTSAAPNKREELAWGFGLRYTLAPDRALLMQIGKSERGYSDLNAWIGCLINYR